MAIAEVPSWMYAERDSLRERIGMMERGELRFGEGPSLASTETTQVMLDRTRQLLVEHEIMLAAFEAASNAPIVLAARSAPAR